MSILLKLIDVNLTYRTNGNLIKVLQDVSFELNQNETISIVGESGSGKSITSLSIVSLLPLNAIIKGSIIFNKKELIGLNENELQKIRGNKISFIFQEPMTSLNPLHTIEKQINSFNRQALHAKILAFKHPRTGEEISFNSKRPNDFQNLIKTLQN